MKRKRQQTIIEVSESDIQSENEILPHKTKHSEPDEILRTRQIQISHKQLDVVLESVE